MVGYSRVSKSKVSAVDTMTIQIKWDGTPVAFFQDNKGTAVLNFPNILKVTEHLPHTRFFWEKKLIRKLKISSLI